MSCDVQTWLVLSIKKNKNNIQVGEKYAQTDP